MSDVLHGLPAGKTHYHGLDVLRAFACLMVVFSHFRNALFPSWDQVPHGLGTAVFYLLTCWGHQAVVVFFVLSGFLVGGRTLQAYQDGRFNVFSFVVSRGCRIVIPLLFVSLLSVMSYLWVGVDIPFLRICGNLLSLQGLCCQPLWGPWWALSVEVWFYAFLGSLLATLSLKGWRRCCAVVLFLLMTVLFFSGRGWARFASLLVFGEGLGAYYFFAYVNKRMGRRSVSIFAAGMLISVAMCGAHLGASGFTADLVLGCGVSLLVCCICLDKPRSAFRRAIETVGSRLSLVSYSVYLSHILCMAVMMNGILEASADADKGTSSGMYNVIGTPMYPAIERLDCSSFAIFVACVSISVAVGYVVWMLSECWVGRLCTTLYGNRSFRR